MPSTTFLGLQEGKKLTLTQNKRRARRLSVCCLGFAVVTAGAVLAATIPEFR